MPTNKPKWDDTKPIGPNWDDTHPIESPSLGQQASDFWESMKSGIPGAGLAEKAGRATRAGLMSIGSDKPYSQIYKEETNRDIADKAEIAARSPNVALAGNVAGALVAPNPSSIVGRVGLNAADAATRAESLPEAEKNAGVATAVSAGLEALPYVGKSLKGLGGKFTNKAEKLAESATGATGKQSEKFAETAGRELLDQGVVKAFYSPEKIAGKAGKQLQAAYDEIDGSLKALDDAGAFVSRDEIVSALQKEAEKLPKGPSSAAARKRFTSEIEETASGPEKYSLQEAELEKRTYQHDSNYEQEEKVKDIKRKVARAWRDVVEEKATAIDPKLAETFKVGKQRFAIFSPIEAAAAKRASQLNQSPYGGLLDMASIASGVGGALASQVPGSALYGVGLAALRRGLAPRAASTAAVAFDKLGQGLSNLGNKVPSIGLPGQMAVTRGLTYPGQKPGLQLPGR